uniref:Uncharacterized protein n=1 Tax=Rhizophora mucronata TaxID=61149 RepID=A0A2P2NBP1_RHIMU
MSKKKVCFATFDDHPGHCTSLIYLQVT